MKAHLQRTNYKRKLFVIFCEKNYSTVLFYDYFLFIKVEKEVFVMA